jgi:hypothetical protein
MTQGLSRLNDKFYSLPLNNEFTDNLQVIT